MHRMSVEEMTAIGEKVSALPLLDTSSPKEILDDLHEPRLSSITSQWSPT
tara:strand:- start:622 stop:771 length:150 start_codon:yes stop_codon:yes gene_type:complete